MTEAAFRTSKGIPPVTSRLDVASASRPEIARAVKIDVPELMGRLFSIDVNQDSYAALRGVGNVCLSRTHEGDMSPTHEAGCRRRKLRV